LRRNEAFQGLCQEDAQKLECYVHLRNVHKPENKLRLDEPSAPFNKNFMECIALDQPRGCWNFQFDMAKERSLGRS